MDLKAKLQSAIEHVKQQFMTLRTGRANPDLLQAVTVDAYGQQMPLNQVGSVSVLDARTLSVNVWDKTSVAATDKAIREAGLGLNPVVDGQLLRIPLPELNAERRTELAKVARKYAEDGRIAVRNIRRDAMDEVKKEQKDGDISEDDLKREEGVIQKAIDAAVADIDQLLAKKEQDIQSV